MAITPFHTSPEQPSPESFQSIPDARTRVHAGVGRLKWAIYQQFPQDFVPASKEVRNYAAQMAAKQVGSEQQEKQFANDVEALVKSVAEDPSHAAFLASARQDVDNARKVGQ